MTLAICGASMTPMPMTLVDQLQVVRIECGFQPGTYQAEPFLAHGRTCLKGRTSTDSHDQLSWCCPSDVFAAIQATWAITISSVNPSMPNSLKFTQTASEKL